MMLRRLTRVAVLAAGLATVYVPAAGAQANDVTQFCRFADESGFLDQIGATRGECLNTLRGPASKQAKNFAAGLCGAEFVQQQVGATNKGQCIQIVSDLPNGDL